MQKIFRLIGVTALAVVFLFMFVACDTGSGGGGGGGDVVLSINGAEDLAKIGSSEYPLNGKYELKSNITLDNWMPIGAAQGLPFTGTFDGKGFTITLNSFNPTAETLTTNVVFGPGSGSGYEATMGPLGIFWFTKNAEIKNITINLNFPETDFLVLNEDNISHSVGGIAGIVQNTVISNIEASGSLLVHNDKIGRIFLGAISGYTSNMSNIKDCKSSVEIACRSENSRVYVGGITGTASSSSKIERCHTTGIVTAFVPTANDSHTRAGGIAGYIMNGVNITDCSSTGDITAENDSPGTDGNAEAGGITAYAQQGSTGVACFDVTNPNHVRITRCFSSGDVIAIRQARASRAGGIVAHINIEEPNGFNIYISQCYSTGDINAQTTSGTTFRGNAGGIMGEANINVSGYHIRVEQCYSMGDISSTGTIGGDAAGIGRIGGLPNFSSTTIDSCFALNREILAPRGNAGRIIPWNAGTLSNNYAFKGMRLTNNYELSSEPVTGTLTDIHGLDKTGEEILNDKTIFEGLFSNFNNNWKWLTGHSFPVLIWQTTAPSYKEL